MARDDIVEVLILRSNLEKHTITVEGMSCGHCENAIEKAVKALPGVQSATVDLVTKTLIIEFDISKTTLDQIKATVDEEGYQAL